MTVVCLKGKKKMARVGSAERNRKVLDAACHEMLSRRTLKTEQRQVKREDRKVVLKN